MRSTLDRMTAVNVPALDQSPRPPLSSAARPDLELTQTDRIQPRRLAVFIDSFGGGGVQRTSLTLAGALADRGHSVDLVVCQAVGPLRDSAPARVRVVALKPAGQWQTRRLALAADPAGFVQLLRPILLRWKLPRDIPCLPDLVNYLRRERPDALLAATPYLNLIAVWAKRLAHARTRILVSERNNLSFRIKNKPRQRSLPPLLGRAYMMADVIAVVSDAVGDDLASTTGLPRGSITTIYNAVVPSDLQERAREPIDHPWFVPGAPPVVLGVGRLTATKDFATLVRAFAQVREARKARLMILGEGKNPDESAELIKLATELGVAEDVALPGFVTNPFAYMTRASVFVLPSVWEGFGNVIVEALACGCPVVSTDCPDGPAEILDHGRYGRLVPVGDHAAMAEAILHTLRALRQPDILRSRAALFSVDRAAESHLAALFKPS